ncbi:unnamed protein product, partial [Arabidopsis halleri]
LLASLQFLSLLPPEKKKISPGGFRFSVPLIAFVFSSLESSSGDIVYG